MTAGRDNRLDLIRGYAMLAIAVNHVTFGVERLGFSQQNVPTLSSFGYSTAASLFFGLSGYLVGLVYLRRPGWAGALWKRAWLIYRVNAVAFAVALLLAAVLPSLVSNALEQDVILAHPVRGTLLFLTMLQQPNNLDVLQMYVILMLAAPLVALGIQRRPTTTLLISGGVYVATQFFTWLALPQAILTSNGEWTLAGSWGMNLLSWQFLFYGAMYAGTLAAHQKLFAWLEASSSRRVAVYAVYAVFAASKLVEKLGLWGYPALADKGTLAPLRLAHFVLTILFLSSLLVTFRAQLDRTLSRLLALVGRQTLYGFAASIPATSIAVGFWFAAERTYAAYLLSCALVVGVVIIASWAAESLRSPKRIHTPMVSN